MMTKLLFCSSRTRITPCPWLPVRALKGPCLQRKTGRGMVGMETAEMAETQREKEE